MSGLYRLLLLILLVGSAGLSWRSVEAVIGNPAVTPLVERSAEEIVAATDRLVAAEATPERLNGLLARRLAEDPRNWVALAAIAELFAERALPLPDSYQAAWNEDSGIVAQTGACLGCAWDIATCTLSTALLCKAPILLTPVEDLRGITKAGVDYASGAGIDRLDLGLSVAGLSATALIAATGGTSAGVKAGTALVRLARGMRLMTPKLTAMMTSAFADGIRWADIPAVRSLDDLPGLLRADALAPVAATLSDLGRTREVLGARRTLHLLPLIDDVADARTLARVSQALGARTVSRVELIGKSRLFRATLRVSNTAAELTAGLVGLVAGLGAALSNLIQSFAFGRLRRARAPVRPPRRR